MGLAENAARDNKRKGGEGGRDGRNREEYRYVHARAEMGLAGNAARDNKKKVRGGREGGRGEGGNREGERGGRERWRE